MDPGQPVVDVQPMSARVAETVGPQRLIAGLFGAFSLVALLLAAAGIYAVVSVLVGQRTAELGLRMALGADRSTILADVLSDTATPAGVGLGFGVVGGVLIAWGVRGMLYGVSPWDPVTFVAVPLGIALVTLAAAFFPALRAARLDPAIAFRR